MHPGLQAISFFLAILLLSIVAIRWLWNRVAVEFPSLPRLTLSKAAAVVAAWGLLFLVVLTMIAVTRELMMPGSWQKVGLLYHTTGRSTSALPGPKEAIYTLLFGWIGFLARTLPKVTVNAPAIVTGSVITVLLVAVLDGLARWSCRAPRRWRFRWTLEIVAAVVLMFIVGFSAIALARQTGWLFTMRG